MNRYYISDMKQGQKAKILRMPKKGHSGFRLAELGLRHGQPVFNHFFLWLNDLRSRILLK